jgi:hypothetical protein
LEAAVSAKEVEVTTNPVPRAEVFLFDSAVPAARVPAMAVTYVIEKGIPVPKPALRFKEEEPRKQPLVWRRRPQNARCMPRLIVTDRSNDADMSYTPTVNTDVWREEHQIANLRCQMRR